MTPLLRLRSSLAPSSYSSSQTCQQYSITSTSVSPASPHTHASQHATAMLTYPDRQKFQLIRARWETAQLIDNDSSDMVGRGEEQVSQQPLNVEPHLKSGSKFRRKLSHGLSFFSHPLMQRKTTPAHHQLTATSLAKLEPATTEEPPAVTKFDGPLSPVRNATSCERSDGSPTRLTTSTNTLSPRKVAGPDVFPTLLPRSRTLSFIPRPVRAGFESSAINTGGHTSPSLPSALIDRTTQNTPSKIPTPSPPLSERRRVSPRQYTSQYTSLPARHIPVAAAVALSRKENKSPAKIAFRSNTTSNLVQAVNSPQPASFLASKGLGSKRPIASLTPQNPTIGGYVPVGKRVTQRRSQIQGRTMKNESLAVPGTNASYKSFRTSAPLARSKRSNYTTPPKAPNRLSSPIAHQAPMTVRRFIAKEQVNPNMPDLSQSANCDAVIQPRLLNPDVPPSPSLNLPVVDLAQLTLPRSNTEKDFRKILGAPHGLAGIWQSSRPVALTKHEVRRLPYSHTFHNFGTQREASPPVPPIPAQYRTTSLSNLNQPLRISRNSPIKLSPIKIRSEATACESIPEGMPGDMSDRSADDTSSRIEPSQIETSRSNLLLRSNPRDRFVATSQASQTSSARQYAPPEEHRKHGSDSQNIRPWSISELHYPESANINPFLQVKEYMPPLYWAGRFQSRFDQWRTEAMIAELNPNHHPTGPLSECRLDQEKLAVCYIFTQMRGLCTSNQAADSLWVSRSNSPSFTLLKRLGI